MRRGQFLFPAAIALCGAYAMWDALARMTYYDEARGAPGPGFLPFWLAVGMIALGAILGLRALRSASAPRGGVAADRASRVRPAWALAALALALLALEPLGFIVTVALLVLSIGRALGERRRGVLVATALGSALGLYTLFGALGVSLPPGVLGF